MENIEYLEYIKTSYLEKFKKEIGENINAGAVSFDLNYTIDKLDVKNIFVCS